MILWVFHLSRSCKDTVNVGHTVFLLVGDYDTLFPEQIAEKGHRPDMEFSEVCEETSALLVNRIFRVSHMFISMSCRSLLSPQGSGWSVLGVLGEGKQFPKT